MSYKTLDIESMTYSSSKDGIRCYLCGCHIRPDYLYQHVKCDHTNEEKSAYIADDLLDFWKEEQQLLKEEMQKV